MSPLDVDWVREAERLHHRYLVEIVEACGLCPWARGARLAGRTRVHVVLDEDDERLVAASIAALDGWAGDERVDVGFLVYPRLRTDRLEFDRLVARLRSADAERHAYGAAPFALATFHPDAEPDLDDPERLVPFLRRTPDRCVQATRMSVLERVRSATPDGTQFVDPSTIDPSVLASAPLPVGERIARANLETVRRMGGARQLAGRVEAIARDRDQAYAALRLRGG